MILRYGLYIVARCGGVAECGVIDGVHSVCIIDSVEVDLE